MVSKYRLPLLISRSGIADLLCPFLTGSPWGAGTLAGTDGSRKPSALELEIAGIQGQQFYEIVARAIH